MKVDASDDFPSQRGDGFRFFLPFIFQGVMVSTISGSSADLEEEALREVGVMFFRGSKEA